MPSKDAAQVILTALVEIQYIDGDGSRCLQCDDTIFEQAGELVVTIGVTEGKKPPTEVRPLDGLFCQSCAQVLEEQLKDNEGEGSEGDVP